MAPDLWEGDVAVDEFALPGDTDRLAEMGVADPAETPAEEPAAEGPARDEQGRFTSQADGLPEVLADRLDESAEPTNEPTPEPAVEAVAEEDRVARLLAKYGGDERKALEAAVEAQSTIGSMERELGSLRQQAERAQQLEQWAQQVQAQQYAPSQASWEEMLAERPAEAANQAFAYGQQTNDWRPWQQASAVWDEVSPGASSMWVHQQQLAAENQRLSRYYQEQILGQKVTEVADKLGGLDESLTEIVPMFPMLMRALSDPNTSPEEVAQTLEVLELVRRGLDTGELAKQAQETARKLARDEERAVEEAGVVTASRTNPEPPRSAAEVLSEDWWEDDRRFNEGWNLG